MSGTLEQLIEALNRNTAEVAQNNALLRAGNGGTGVTPAQQPVQQVQQQPVQQTQQYVDPLALAPAQQPAQNLPQRSADDITNLIQPHVANDAVKAALGVAMRSMGINALPEAQPHQYSALYAAFEGVIRQHAGGQTAGAATSII